MVKSESQKEPKAVQVEQVVLDAIDLGAADSLKDQRWTLDEALEHARESRKAWAKKPGDQGMFA